MHAAGMATVEAACHAIADGVKTGIVEEAGPLNCRRLQTGNGPCRPNLP